jgi:cell division protein FtsB
MDFKEKKKFKNIFYTQFTVFILAVILIFSVHGVWGVYKKASIAYSNRNLALNNLNELKERESELVLKIKKLKTDRGIEEEIREKFGVVKKGEEMVIIVDSKDEKSKNDKERTIGIIESWWQNFLGIFNSD